MIDVFQSVTSAQASVALGPYTALGDLGWREDGKRKAVLMFTPKSDKKLSLRSDRNGL